MSFFHPYVKTPDCLQKWSCVAALLWCGAPGLKAADYYVSPQGNDGQSGNRAQPWKTLQRAATDLHSGDTVHVLPGTYHEKVTILSGGTKEGGPVSLVAEGAVILSGEGIPGENILRIQDKNYVTIAGFELRDNLNVKDGSGIRVEGACDHIELKNNRIHEIRGKDAMGITVYGKNTQTPVSNLLIEGNEIFDCDPAKSEALTLNGNIDGFKILHNIVRNVNNIGICMIGGEGWVNRDRGNVTRHGLCKGNKVSRARSNYGGGYAAGIYVDGGTDIVIEDNEVTGCDLGIEVGAENRGAISRAVTVQGNQVYLNDKAGIVFGGYEAKAGRVEDCTLERNICYHNDRHHDHNGELWIQLASRCKVEKNTFWSGNEGQLVQSVKGAEAIELDHNTYFSDAGEADAAFTWHDKEIEGYQTYVRVSQQDTHSRFVRPGFRAPDRGDFAER